MTDSSALPRPVADLGTWLRALPVLFVLLWSTGFIAGKAGLAHAGPLMLLELRFVAVVLLMLALALAMRAPWPADARQVAHIAVAGLLVQAGYLVGCFVALAEGLAAGVVALICGLQPILTAFAAAPLLGERVSARQWTGLGLGLAGVALVLAHKVDFSGATAFSVGMAAMALVSITLGTVYQKRFCGHFDLRTGSVIQFAAAAFVLAPFVIWVPERAVAWTPAFVAALAWLVLVLSIFTISLLSLLIRRGAATRTASLFYLVPAVTALMAWGMFGETLSGWALAGMALTMAGVALVSIASS